MLSTGVDSEEEEGGQANREAGVAVLMWTDLSRLGGSDWHVDPEDGVPSR